MFHASMEYISHVHLENSPETMFGRGVPFEKNNSEGD